MKTKLTKGDIHDFTNEYIIDHDIAAVIKLLINADYSEQGGELISNLISAATEIMRKINRLENPNRKFEKEKLSEEEIDKLKNSFHTCFQDVKPPKIKETQVYKDLKERMGYSSLDLYLKCDNRTY